MVSMESSPGAAGAVRGRGTRDDVARAAAMYDANRLDQFALAKGISDKAASRHSLGVGLLTMLEAFSERTTSHGLPHIYHARGR